MPVRSSMSPHSRDLGWIILVLSVPITLGSRGLDPQPWSPWVASKGLYTMGTLLNRRVSNYSLRAWAFAPTHIPSVYHGELAYSICSSPFSPSQGLCLLHPHVPLVQHCPQSSWVWGEIPFKARPGDPPVLLFLIFQESEVLWHHHVLPGAFRFLHASDLLPIPPLQLPQIGHQSPLVVVNLIAWGVDGRAAGTAWN